MKPMQNPENSSGKNHRPSKRRGSGAVVVAVTAVTAFLIGSVGYEVIKGQRTIQQPHSLFPTQLASLSLDSLQSNPNGYNIRLLNEKNRQQAERIKELQKELAELNHSFHEYKLSLFSRSNPIDIAQIQNLTKELESKSQTINILTQQIKALDPGAKAAFTPEQELAIHQLAEEANMLGNVKDILHAQLSRNAEQQLASHVTELEALQYAAQKNEQFKNEYAKELAMIVELDRTIALLRIEKNSQKIAKLISIYDRKLALKDETNHKLQQALDQVKDAQDNIGMYVDALVISEVLRSQQQEEFSQKQASIKENVNAIKERYNATIANLNDALQKEKAKTLSLYGILEAQNLFLAEAYNKFDSKNTLLSQALEHYDQVVDKMQRIEMQKGDLEQVVANYSDMVQYQLHSSHTQNAENYSRLSSIVAAYQDTLASQDNEIQTLKKENEELLLSIAAYYDAFHYSQLNSNKQDKEIAMANAAFQATSSRMNDRITDMENQNTLLQDAVQEQKNKLKLANEQKNSLFQRHKELADKYTSQQDLLDYHQNNAVKMNKSFDKASQEIKNLKTSMETMKSQLDDYRIASSQYLQQLAQQEILIGALNQKIDQFEQNNSKENTQNQELTISLLDRDHQLYLLSDKLSKSDQQHAKTLASLNKAVQALKTSKTQNQQLSDELNKTRDLLSKAHTLNDSQKETLVLKDRELRNAIESEITIRRHLIEQIAQLQTNLDLLTAERELHRTPGN